ncbi:hypothetical protein [Enhydrobacter sp.]|jgi:hypothetical protein|uniref:hypothetical protein n=1 Tax=Enhydrobacter sp. TaxID=1894999 RepID=UPI00261EC5A9|nr:hypothetical protein [Enhydrobacter sp.]WIM12658.1 MAG: hypothetical protein OJF58_003621 [Enhydrobacter sp.]
MSTNSDLPGYVFILLIALAALSGWLTVRALRCGRMELRGGRFVIDRSRQPFLFWSLLAVFAAVPLAYFAYILAVVQR